MKLMALLAIVGVISVTVLLSSSAVSADSVKVFYDNYPGIDVEFPNGEVINKGGDLIVVISSDKYDISNAEITLFPMDAYGVADTTNQVHNLNHEYSKEGNVATHTFWNVETDVKMISYFPGGLKLLDESGNDVEENELIPVTDTDKNTLILAATAVCAALLFVITAMTYRRMDLPNVSEVE